MSWSGLRIFGLWASSGFGFRAQVGLGFPKFVFKPVGLVQIIAKLIVILVIEPIGLSSKPADFGVSRA